MSECILSLKNVSKMYYGNAVLKNISVDLRKGEVLSIVGENGAGKSTLMNILFGMPVIHSTGGFEGSIEIGGRPASISSPHAAMLYGIGMVHQEFMLIPGFTITENIKLNRETTKPNLASRILGKQLETLDSARMSEDARKALGKLDIGIEEYTLVEGLPVGYMQFVEIAREIDKTGIKILVLDEPTAVLTESEASKMLDAVRKLADSGIGVVFISHRLDEVLRIADKVVVLRDGEQVASKNARETSIAEIAQLMVGRDVGALREASAGRVASAETILEVEDLYVDMPGEEVKGISMEVKRGEILGIGGLAGQGKIGIANGLMGVCPARGRAVFRGGVLPLNDPKASIQAGLGFVSEDRRGIGLLLDESIEMNIAISAMQIKDDFLQSLGFMKVKKGRAIRRHANEMIAALDIRCVSPLQRAGRLSGGNQQKVCIARALTLKPALLLVSEPTRGIDIGAKKLVLDLVAKLNKDQGMTVIMTSSELAELRSVCDRIMIVCEGKVQGILAPDASDAEFGLMMSGSSQRGENGGGE